MIIGISGRKGAGKDTAMLSIYSKVNDLTFDCGCTRFSDGLKFIMGACFGLDSLDSQESKSQVMGNGRTVRENLQLVGTDTMRSIDPDCWVNWWKCKVRESYGLGNKHIVVPDVRFPNEVKAIQDMGGKVLRLTRCPHPEDEHESETALDRMQELSVPRLCKLHRKKLGDAVFDAVLDNSAMTIPEQNEAVWDIVKGWI